jgi:hypothetical protein
MADDVLRLRATVVSEEALANIRNIGREIGLIPRRAGQGVKEATSQFAVFGQTIRKVGSELTTAIPALGAFGLGAAGAGIAAGMVIRTLNETANRIVELKEASKELGMSERDIRAWARANEEVGVSTEKATANLQGFKQVTEGLKYNIGGVRDQLNQIGAGPLVGRLMATTDQAERLKLALEFGKGLSVFQRQKVFETLGLGLDSARVSMERFASAQAHAKPISDEDVAQAIKYHKLLVEIGEEWELLKIKGGSLLFPLMSVEIKGWQSLIDLMDIVFKHPVRTWQALTGQLDPGAAKPGDFSLNKPPPKGSPLFLDKPDTFKDRFGAPSGGQQLSPEQFKNFRPSPITDPRFKPTAFGGGGGGTDDDASRIVKVGVFDALVDFKSYTETGGGGFTPASFGGTAGAAAGGGAGGIDNSPIGRAFRNGGGAGGDGGTTPGEVPRSLQSGGGSAGITAPAGTAIQRQGMATVTTSGGRKFQVDKRFAANFQGFINDYEKAGGVIGPQSGTLGHRPHNASGHPIGAAIDINQVGYGVRGRGGQTLPVGTENELAEKWGLVSGANWRRPDTGHFGVRSTEAARQALIRNGVEPDEASRIATSQTGGQSEGGKTVKGSWFGSSPGWADKMSGKTTASGAPVTVPGIALPSRAGLGKMFEVTTPDGRKFMLPQTDVGPGKNTGRGIDITSTAASQMGYTPKTFPTDGGFSYRRIDNAVAPKINGNVAVTVNSNGTRASTDVKSEGPLFLPPSVRSYQQMQPTEKPSTFSERFSGGAS